MDAPAPHGNQFDTWDQLADEVLDGNLLSQEQGLSILRAADDELLSLLAAASRVRKHYFGNTVHLYYLKNAKSGLCSEDCGYCSRVPVAEYPKPQTSANSVKSRVQIRLHKLWHRVLCHRHPASMTNDERPKFQIFDIERISEREISVIRHSTSC